MIIQLMHRKYRLPDRRVVLLNVLYFMPGCESLLQEFIWQVEDEVPDLPRVHRFLCHWQHHIDAVIKDVSVSNGGAAIACWRHGELFEA